MGKGKTIVALVLSDKLNAKTLIIAPPYLRLNWVEEIQDKFINPPRFMLIDSPRKASDSIPEDCRIIISSYTLLEHLEKHFQWADLVVGDEIHFCKNPQAARTDIFDKLLYESEVPRFLGLSGTPILNGVQEWYQLIKFCSYNIQKTSGLPMRFSSHYQFNSHFCNVDVKRFGGRQIRRYYGFKNQEELNELLIGKYLPSPPEELDRDGLPPLYREDIQLASISDPSLLEEFNKNKPIGTDSSAKCKAALKMVPLAIEYIKGLEAGGVKKLVIFSDHREPVLEYGKRIGATTILGGDAMDRRKDIMRDFQAGNIQYLAGTFGAMGIGNTLTAANHMVVNDFPWVPGVLEQGEKRIHRIGQKNPCYSYRLLGSLQSKHILKLLTSKEKIIKEAL